jgi:hypothetical protein
MKTILFLDGQFGGISKVVDGQQQKPTEADRRLLDKLTLKDDNVIQRFNQRFKVDARVQYGDYGCNCCFGIDAQISFTR